MARKPLNKSLHKPIRAPKLAAAQAASAALRPTKRRRVSPGGTTMLGGTERGQRQSGRQTAVKFAAGVDERLAADDAKRLRLRELKERKRAQREAAGIVKKRRVLTQAELVAEALTMEEHNKKALDKFYAEEVLKADVVTASWGSKNRALGPRMTFLSRSEGVRRPLVEVVGEDSVAVPPTPPNFGMMGNVAPSEPEAHTRNYVIFEDMRALSDADVKLFLFGEHVDWSKGRSHLTRGVGPSSSHTSELTLQARAGSSAP